MPEVTIRSFAKFREMFGEINKVNIEGKATVYDCIEKFAESNDTAKSELFSSEGIKGHIIIMFNRERIDIEEAKENEVRDGDEIVFYPPVSGG